MSEKEISITIPVLGEGIDQVKVVSVLVQKNSTVQENENLIEVESEKASLEIPTPYTGKIVHLAVKVGQIMKVGDEILRLIPVDNQEEKKDDLQKSPTIESQKKPEPPPEKTSSEDQEPTDAVASDSPSERVATPQPSEPVAAKGALIPASPSVRRFARELGIDIRQVSSSVGGRISEADIKAYSKKMMGELQNLGPASNISVHHREGVEPQLPDFSRWGKIRREGLDMIRRKTAEHMSLANQVIPQVTQFDDCDITELEKFRKQKNILLAKQEIKITITAIICKILAVALQRMPVFNASIDFTNQKMIYKEYVHIAIAVDTPAGLLVPVIENVDQKDLQTVAREMSELAQLARNKKLSPKQMQGGNITITNLGGLGTSYFTPIVNWPQVAILGLGQAKQQPIYEEKKEGFLPRLIMPLSISYDHRAIDGAQAAKFLRWICDTMKHPINILLS